MRVEEPGPPRRLLHVLWAGLWIAYGLWVLRSGVLTGSDTATYSRWADLLIAHRFNLASYLREQSFVVPPVLYIGWIVVVAGLKTVAGASWMSALVALNWLSFGAGSYAVLSTVRRTTASAGSLLLAAFLFAAAGDLLIFIPFVLSDLLFWGMACGVLAAGSALSTADPDHDGERGRAMRSAMLGTALVLVALAFRPVGVPLLVFWAAALASWFARGLVDRFAMAIVIVSAGLALVAIAWHAAIMIDAGAWPFGTLPAMLALLAGEYREGVLVYAPESNLVVEPAVTWVGAMRLTMQKLFYFVTPWLPHYSPVHTLMNLAFFVPAYGLTIAAVMNRSRLSPAQRRTVVTLVLFLLSVAVFHALLQIEYDHRYRLPVLPALVMLAAIGLESVRRPQTLASSARGKWRATAGG